MTRHRRTFLAAMATLAAAGCIDSATEQIGSEEESDSETNGDASEAEEDEAVPLEEELLFDFQDIHEWDLMAGNLSPDREQYVTGDLSARLDGDRNAALRMERTGLDLDLTRHRFSIVSQLHSSDPTQSVDIIATDSGGNDMRFRTRFFKTDEETTFMPLDLGIYEYDEGVDLSSIQTLRVQTLFGETASGTLWIDSIYLTPTPETPVLMIQWDDGFESQYTDALPIQREYDVPSTTFVNTTNIGNGRLSVDQLTEMQEYGWDISSHLMTHQNLTELSEQEQEAQIRGAQEWLVDNGFEQGAEFFSYTYGTYDQSSYELVEEYHTYAMVGGDPGYGLPHNPAHVGRSSERSLEDARAYIDTLVQWGGVGALFWHELPAETPVGEFEEIMRYIAERRDDGELDVLTLSGLAELQGR